MRQVIAGSGVLFLGKQGENEATVVRFPVAEKWAELYGEGVFQLLFKRPSETQAYACVVSVDGEYVDWVITNTEVLLVGQGRAELCYFVGNTLAKSETWITASVATLADVGSTPPEPWESWVEDVLSAASDIEVYAERAEAAADIAVGAKADALDAKDEAVRQAGLAQASAETASAKAELATTKASQASGYALNASNAATRAGNAADRAENAQTVAENSAQTATEQASLAVGAADDAVDAKNDAVSAKNDAQSARDGAVESASAAETSAAQAKASEDQAKIYADAPFSLIAFDIDPITGDLLCGYTNDKESVDFTLTDTGDLVVEIPDD